MTTSTPPSQQYETDGRTVREVVECNQELVNEAWCRKIIRQLLQSLEMQYAMQLPHRPITPETVLVLDSGDPLLLPTADSGAPGLEADDMHDLAAVMHYAITREYPASSPLRGRALGYNPVFLAAIDRCLAPDPAQRPQDIAAMRDLLGIVPLGPAVAPPPPPPAVSSQAAPQPAPAAPIVQQRTPEHAGPGQRKLMLAGAVLILCCAIGGLAALLYGTDSRDALALAVPAAETVEDTAAVPAPASASSEAGEASETLPASGMQSPADTAPVASVESAPAASAAPIKAAAPNAASYKLLIKPWAMVEVDGVAHGASPPLKRLSLAPGPHTIRILNPNFPEHTVTVHAVKGETSVIELDLTEETIE